MHTITNIPIGSNVCIWIYGRHPQGKIVCNTGAIQVRATEIAYPLKVSVRPTARVAAAPGGMSNYGKMNPQDGNQLARAGGHDIDFWILTPDEFCDGTMPKFLRSRMNRADAEAVQVHADPSPATDIYGRIFCDRCHRQIDSGALCDRCAGAIEGIDLCTAPDKRDTGFYECKSPLHPGLKVCTRHAEEQGLIAPAAPPAGACVWSGCKAARYRAYVMCAEHAIEAGLVGGAPQSPVTEPIPDASVDVMAPTPKKRGFHNPKCQCRICTRRRDTADIVAAHDSVDSVAESVAVLSGVDTGEGAV